MIITNYLRIQLNGRQTPDLHTEIEECMPSHPSLHTIQHLTHINGWIRLLQLIGIHDRCPHI